MSLVSTIHNKGHYNWGKDCDGWILVESEGLSVKQEKMPPATAEALHYHRHAQQFFFILKGTAVFEVESALTTVEAGQGFHIAAGKRHRILNNSATDLEFILSSQPATSADRINC